jgi:hypothetical protein
VQVEPAAALAAAAAATGGTAAAIKLKQLPGSLLEALAALQRDNSLQVTRYCCMFAVVLGSPAVVYALDA